MFYWGNSRFFIRATDSESEREISSKGEGTSLQTFLFKDSLSPPPGGVGYTLHFNLPRFLSPSIHVMVFVPDWMPCLWVLYGFSQSCWEEEALVPCQLHGVCHLSLSACIPLSRPRKWQSFASLYAKLRLHKWLYTRSQREEPTWWVS